MSDVLLVLVTFPDADKAREIGTQMVERQLAACVNLLPGVTSIYRWQGKVCEDAEVLAIFKTRQPLWTAFAAAIQEAHPYDVPEIVALHPAEIAANYARWVTTELPAIHVSQAQILAYTA